MQKLEEKSISLPMEKIFGGRVPPGFAPMYDTDKVEGGLMVLPKGATRGGGAKG